MDRFYLRDSKFIFEDISYPAALREARVPGDHTLQDIPQETLLFLDIIIDSNADPEDIERDIEALLDQAPPRWTRIARPVPLCRLTERTRERILQFSPPSDCSRCLHLFTVDEGGNLAFCSAARDAPPFSFDLFPDRKAIYDHFVSFAPALDPNCTTCKHWLSGECSACRLKGEREKDTEKTGIRTPAEGKRQGGSNVTLFFPPIPNGPDVPLWPALGPAYLDAQIRDEFTSTVVDSSLFFNVMSLYKWIVVKRTSIRQWRKREKEILNFLIRTTESTHPDYLGISSWTYNMPFIAEFTREFKKRNPSTTVILGGINPTLIPQETLMQFPYVDYLVRGEGERTLKELLRTLRDGKSAHDVKGISFMDGGICHHTPDRPKIKNLDEFKFMDYENFLGFREWNKKLKMPFMQVMTSRGCIAKCSFCSVYGTWGGQRFHSAEYVRGQLEHLNKLYEFSKKTIAFMDDNFVTSTAKTKNLINTVQKSFPASEYDYEVVGLRVDMLSDELLDFFHESNCTYLGFGVESMNKNSLIYMNKCLVSPDEYRNSVFRIIEKLDRYRIRSQLSSIIGLPEETEEDMLEQANFFIDAYNNYKWASHDVCPLVIHPKTPDFSKVEKGELTIYRRPKGSPKRFYEGLFADKYEHLLTFVPNAYRVENKTMSRERFEYLLDKIFNEKLKWMGQAGRDTYGGVRDYVDRIVP